MRKSFLLILFVGFCSTGLSQTATSVLASGNWYKIAVSHEDIYKLTYSDLQSLGVNLLLIDPRNIRIYGNGGGMLPTENSDLRPDDLVECAIKVSGEADGVFDLIDYVIFYGQDQHRWKYDSSDQHFHHEVNIYSDTTYYFLNTDIGPGKRIVSQPSLTQVATDLVSSFDDFQFHELDTVNFLRSGKEWFGEQFDSTNQHLSFPFSFPNLDQSNSAYVKANVAGRSFIGATDWIISIPPNDSGFSASQTSNNPYLDYAKAGNGILLFNSTTDTFSISIDFASVDPIAKGWLNWLEVSCRRALSAGASPLFFRDLNSAGPGKITEFNINNAHLDSVWDITEHNNVIRIEATNGASSFRINTDNLRELVAFNESTLTSPILIGAISNQNLHGLPEAQLLIITHSSLLAAAENLASHHRSFDGLTVNVSTVDQIYNEFSSGSQDVTALRDFIRMFYFRATTVADTPRYVLLFGDASYDYKFRLQPNSNMVPCYETKTSLEPTRSFSSDDYFTFMDSTEGDHINLNDKPDLGIGRLPARTLNEANIAVNKIIHYATGSDFNRWRKEIVIAADDQDNNTNLSQAERLCDSINASYCEIDLDKVHMDAFPQIMTPDGPRYPSASSLLANKINDGVLCLNYIGITGINNWGSENFVDTSLIDSISNINHMPFLIVLGDNFNSYDEPYFNSGGELLMLNPDGGAIACLSGSNFCFSGSNFSFTLKLYNHLLKHELRLGDIFKQTSRDYTDTYTRNIVLLGAPALKLNYPVNKVVITELNGLPVQGLIDTLPLGSTISSMGEIQNSTGQLLNGFNGTLEILLLREETDTTLGNDNDSFIVPFKVWHDTLYNGSVTVSNGTFSINYTIPTTTSQYYEKAKFSFYALDGTLDASGCYNDLVIGNIFYSVADILNPLAEIEIIPNPVTSVMHVKVETIQPFPFTCNLFDPQGRKIKSIEDVNSKSFTINCDDLTGGIYFMELKTSRNTLLGRKKIIRQ